MSNGSSSDLRKLSFRGKLRNVRDFIAPSDETVHEAIRQSLAHQMFRLGVPLSMLQSDACKIEVYYDERYKTHKAGITIREKNKDTCEMMKPLVNRILYRGFGELGGGIEHSDKIQISMDCPSLRVLVKGINRYLDEDCVVRTGGPLLSDSDALQTIVPPVTYQGAGDPKTLELLQRITGQKVSDCLSVSPGNYLAGMGNEYYPIIIPTSGPDQSSALLRVFKEHLAGTNFPDQKIGHKGSSFLALSAHFYKGEWHQWLEDNRNQLSVEAKTALGTVDVQRGASR